MRESLLIGIAVAALTMGAAAQTTWYVDDDNCPGPGSGTEGDPFCLIQDAIDAAALAGDQVVVAPGTYPEAIDFLGKAVHLHSADGPDMTIIDGTGLGTSVVTCANGEGAATILQGFTVRGGTGTPHAEETAGGGMFVLSANPTVINCTFTDNTTHWGGGMYVEGDGGRPVKITDCRFTSNSGFTGGGISCEFGGDIEVVNCWFENNTADMVGGGIEVWAASATIINCVFVGNIAAWVGGGTIYNWDGDSTIVNCTLYDNDAPPGSGAGIRNANGSSPTVSNCILWNPGVEIVEIGGSSATVICSNVQDGWPGEGNLNEEPQFVDAGTGNLRLRSGSLCVDAADNTSVPEGITTDLDGIPRFVDDPDTPDTGIPDDVNSLVDMGAYEFCRADTNRDGAVDVEDLVSVILAWGTDEISADTNADGIVDVLDLVSVILNWGPCA